jgi:hypothetical protein
MPKEELPTQTQTVSELSPHLEPHIPPRNWATHAGIVPTHVPIRHRMPIDHLLPDHLFPRRRRSFFVDPVRLMPLVGFDEAVGAFSVGQRLGESDEMGKPARERRISVLDPQRRTTFPIQSRLRGLSC